MSVTHECSYARKVLAKERKAQELEGTIIKASRGDSRLTVTQIVMQMLKDRWFG